MRFSSIRVHFNLRREGEKKGSTKMLLINAGDAGHRS
jgi:hypothetical protein